MKQNQMNQSRPCYLFLSRGGLLQIMYVYTLTMNLEKHSRDLRCSDWPFEKHIQVVDLLVSSAVQQDINQKFSSYKNPHLILNLNMNRADSSLQIKRLMPQKMLKQRLYSDHCKGKLGSFSNLKCILNLAFNYKKFAFKSPYLSHWLDVIFL